MSKMNKLIIGGLIIAVICVVAISVNIVDVSMHKPLTEVVTLERQYIGNVSGHCENCLLLDVSDVQGQRTYYFASEYEIRDDLIDGTEVNVRWEYSHGNYRITSVYN